MHSRLNGTFSLGKCFEIPEQFEILIFCPGPQRYWLWFWSFAGTYLSSFFNYGFNETTWKMYCFKQKKMRP